MLKLNAKRLGPQSRAHRGTRTASFAYTLNALRGFTLVELLVVISIISIIGTIGYINLKGTQDSGRDARRKQDLKAIRTALVSYYQDFGVYPPPCSPSPCTTSASFTSDGGDNWVPGLAPTYIQKLPKDPKQASLSIFLALKDFFNQIFQKPQPAFAQAAQTVTLRPSGSGFYTQWNTVFPAIPHWDAVNDAASDEDSSYVKTIMNTDDKDTFTHPSSGIPPGSTINQIQVVVRARRSLGIQAAGVDGFIRSGTTDSRIVGDLATNTYANFTFTWTTDPATGQPWTIAGVDNVEIGLKPLISDNTSRISVTQVWMEVTYTPPSPSPTPTPTPVPTPTPTPVPTPTPTPSPSPPPLTGCTGKLDVYCYIVDTNRTYFILWAQLDKTNDQEAYNQPNAICKATPPAVNFNYCLESPQ